MRFPTVRTLRTAAVALALVACNADRITGPHGPLIAPTAARLNLANGMPDVRIAEFHYDNQGTDSGEFIELSGPAGQDLTGWSIVVYNGSTAGAAVSYGTRALTGAIPATPSCGTRGVIEVDYPVDGIQNGNTDGFALVDAGGAVVELLSYEGLLTASNGPAAGMTSTDVGVAESNSTTLIGWSLQRQPDGSWAPPAASTRDLCNDDDSGDTTPPAVVATVVVTPAEATVEQGASQAFHAEARDAQDQPIANAPIAWSVAETGLASVSGSGVVTTTGTGDVHVSASSGGVTGAALLHVTPAVPVELPDVRFSEIHYDNMGTDAGERIEVEGPAGTVLTGWTVVLYDGNGGAPYSISALGGTIAGSCNGRGVVLVDYPVNGIQNGPDGMALVDATGAVVEFLSYEGAFAATGGPANGTTAHDIAVSEVTSAPLTGSLKRGADGSWSATSPNNFGSVNACGGGVLDPPSSSSIAFSGRDPGGDPPLPLGFEAQIFATLSVNGTVTPTTITWTSETPGIASIDSTGVVHALAVGTGVFRATAADGTTSTFSLPMAAGVMSATAQYGGNAEFGEPADGNAGDDYRVARAQYTLSYNVNRGTPNWVSYKLDATDYGSEDRCNCFTADPLLPSSFPHFTTADYTGAGAFAGYGIDRGHLARSFDRTAASGDNATTFYLSNIVPQAADLNQGPWAIMENYLGDFARTEGKEVYVVAGVAGNKGTVKGEGKIVIPAQVWKVALILPHGAGLSSVHSASDVQVVAAVMPNEAGVRNVDWTTYEVTVDSVQHLSGYDLFAALPDNVERAIESGDAPPVAAIAGGSAAAEGSSLTFSAAGSSDPDAGDALSYAWSFGDGGSATGVSASHAFGDDGSYTVTVTVTDSHGASSAASLPVSVTNVAPAIASFSTPAAPALVGTPVSAAVTFSDAGSLDTHTAAISWGDGATSTVNAGSASSAGAQHVYAGAGFYVIGVTVRDDDGGAASAQSAALPVYDVQGGAVVGAGWVAEANDGGRHRDKALFEVDARYDRRSGSARGHFILFDKDDRQLLRGESFQYLVVDGQSAVLRGSGVQRNGARIEFIVSALDGKAAGKSGLIGLIANRGKTPDLIRIKVWNGASGEVLFDTNPGAPDDAAPTVPLGGGSVVVTR